MKGQLLLAVLACLLALGTGLPRMDAPCSACKVRLLCGNANDEAMKAKGGIWDLITGVEACSMQQPGAEATHCMRTCSLRTCSPVTCDPSHNSPHSSLIPCHAAADRVLQSIASELQRRLDSELPRNHLDMRHRLDSQGQRYGRVIDYK